MNIESDIESDRLLLGALLGDVRLQVVGDRRYPLDKCESACGQADPIGEPLRPGRRGIRCPGAATNSWAVPLPRSGR